MFSENFSLKSKCKAIIVRVFLNFDHIPFFFNEINELIEQGKFKTSMKILMTKLISLLKNQIYISEFILKRLHLRKIF